METGIAIEQVRVRVLPDGRVSRADAAQFLGIEAKTLANWGLKDYGPKPRRVGGKVFYDIDDLKAFAKGAA